MVPYDRKPTSLSQGAVGSISSFREAGSDSNIDLATVDAFGEEWSRFQSFDERELSVAGDQYFDIVTDGMVGPGSQVRVQPGRAPSYP